MKRRVGRKRAPRPLPSVPHRTRLAYGLTIVLVITLMGTLGYHFLEGWPLADALYMTVISMTTVGYGETFPLSQTGRMFTILLLICSVGAVGYVVSILATFLIEGEFARLVFGRRMDKRIAKLTDHIIVCGAGPTGRRIAEEFQKTVTPFVLVEQSPDVLAHVLAQYGDMVHLQADATQDETLLTAGIERASGLVAALGDDKDNVFVVLSARALNAGLRIIARVVEEENIPKLRKAGADEIVSPNAIGGLRMASLMLRPSVVNFLDQMLQVCDQTLRFEELPMSDAPALVGKTLCEADIGRQLGLLVVAITSLGEYRFNPCADTVLQQDDTLIVIGTPEQLAQFRRLDTRE